MNIEIANRLVNYRKKNNLSQEALAEKLGISRQAVSKWERAEASPDTDNLILLARLYGVSLDELLQTEDEIPTQEEKEDTTSTENNFETDNNANQKTNQNTNPNTDNINENQDTFVHIGSNGIHVTDGGDQVHVDWKGVHVNDKNGNNVNVGWNGVHINEDGQQIQWDGIHTSKDNHLEILIAPIALITVITYLIIGFTMHAWHPGWLLFLFIPVIESLIIAVDKRDANCFAYPVLVVIAFLAIGFFLYNWMGWILFLTIPIYYAVVNCIRTINGKQKYDNHNTNNR